MVGAANIADEADDGRVLAPRIEVMSGVREMACSYYDEELTINRGDCTADVVVLVILLEHFLHQALINQL